MFIKPEFGYQRHKIHLVMHTGLNMVYAGHMNRLYCWCPYCQTVEHQFSAEARDQAHP